MDAKLKQLQGLFDAQKEAGVRRAEIARALFARNFSEAQVGKAMGVHAKTAAAFKVDFTKKGKSEWGNGKWVHIPVEDAKLKRLGGKKVLGKIVELMKEVVGAPSGRLA